jgi:hypothetical protein
MSGLFIKDFFDFASKYTTAVPSQQQKQQQQQQTAHDTVFPLGRGSNPPLVVFYSKFSKVIFSFLDRKIQILYTL